MDELKSTNASELGSDVPFCDHGFLTRLRTRCASTFASRSGQVAQLSFLRSRSAGRVHFLLLIRLLRNVRLLRLKRVVQTFVSRGLVQGQADSQGRCDGLQFTLPSHANFTQLDADIIGSLENLHSPLLLRKRIRSVRNASSCSTRSSRLLSTSQVDRLLADRQELQEQKEKLESEHARAKPFTLKLKAVENLKVCSSMRLTLERKSLSAF